MPWGEVRRRAVRVAGAAQLVVACGVTAIATGTWAAPMWQQHRTSCEVQHLQVVCPPLGFDHTARWVALGAGVGVALLVLALRGPALAAARGVAVLVVASGVGVFGTLSLDWGAARAVACYVVPSPQGQVCGGPAWQPSDLVVALLVGATVGLLVVTGEAASRRAVSRQRVGTRRLAVGLLMTAAVPVGALGCYLSEADSSTQDAFAPWGPFLVVTGVLALATGEVLRVSSPMSSRI